MNILKTLILSGIGLSLFANAIFCADKAPYIYDGEKAVYQIMPTGSAEYEDRGVVKHDGRAVRLVVFISKALCFEDEEKIYSDPKTLLPVRVERAVMTAQAYEHITEEYDQERYIVTTRKYNSDKLISENIIKLNGPVSNTVTTPFYMRQKSDFKIGERIKTRYPSGEYELEVVGLEEVCVPAGKFEAYHLISCPDKVEVWISKDDPRIPVKIQGKGVFGYTMLLTSYNPPK